MEQESPTRAPCTRFYQFAAWMYRRRARRGQRPIYDIRRVTMYILGCLSRYSLDVPPAANYATNVYPPFPSPPRLFRNQYVMWRQFIGIFGEPPTHYIVKAAFWVSDHYSSPSSMLNVSPDIVSFTGTYCSWESSEERQDTEFHGR